MPCGKTPAQEGFDKECVSEAYRNIKRNVLLTARSGADGRPDNSLEFVDYALRTGTDALEVDVRRNSKGILVLGHDGADECAPTLWEVFARVAEYPAIKINCDLKEPGLEMEVSQMAGRAELAGRLIVSGTVDVAVLTEIPDLRKMADVYLNIEEYIPDLYRNYRDISDYELEAADAICAICLSTGIRTVNIYQGLVTRRFIRMLSEKGIGVSAWTVNDIWELKWFLEQGVYNITTRGLTLALSIRNENVFG